MASIRQRSGEWQARVRRKGHPDEVSSFNTKAEAQTWTCSIESAMDTVSRTLRLIRRRQIFGILKGKGVFPEDGLDYQLEIRAEQD